MTDPSDKPTAAKLEITRLRNEQAFIISDRAHGGPERKDEFEAIRKRIKDIQKRLEP